MDKYRLKGRTKPIKTDKPSVDRIKAKGATFKIWNHSLFYKHLGAYAGVIGFLFIINMLTWGSGIWFHWPALGWGLLLFLWWVNIAKKMGVEDKDYTKLRFHKHLGSYAGVIGFLFIINMLTWNGMIWFHWPALGWGLLLFFHWIKVSKHLPKRIS